MRARLLRRLRDDRGFTLIEMIAVMIVMGIVIAGISTIFVGGTHLELNLSTRFQAQQETRVAINQLRVDAHNACAANIGSATGLANGTKLTFALPALGDISTCGANTTAGTKITWCEVTTAVAGRFALYRSVADNGTCSKTVGVSKGDHFTNVFFDSPYTYPSIPYGQYQTVRASLTASFKQGTFGAPDTQAQVLAVAFSAYENTDPNANCPTTGSTATCAGPCPPPEPNSTAYPCQAPTIH